MPHESSNTHFTISNPLFEIVQFQIFNIFVCSRWWFLSQHVMNTYTFFHNDQFTEYGLPIQLWFSPYGFTGRECIARRCHVDQKIEFFDYQIIENWAQFVLMLMNTDKCCFIVFLNLQPVCSLSVSVSTTIENNCSEISWKELINIYACYTTFCFRHLLLLYCRLQI